MKTDAGQMRAAQPGNQGHELGPVPLVSIIMPVFNVEPYIGQAVRSILDQTWTDFELIVINDGSTDGSIATLIQACAADPRVRIHTQENRGLSAARNAGLGKATGSFVYFFDSDDMLEPDALSECMSRIRRDQLDLVAFSGSVFSEDAAAPAQVQLRKPDLLEPRSGAKLLSELEAAGAYSPSACLYVFSRSLLADADLKFTEGYLHEDEAFTPLLYCLATRAVSLGKPLFLRRVRPDSIMTTPLGRRNIEGWVMAASLIFDFRRARARTLPGETLNTLARLQRILLRSTLVRAERHSLSQDFFAALRQRFSMLGLLQSDAMMSAYYLLYRLTGFHGLFRDRKRAR